MGPYLCSPVADLLFGRGDRGYGAKRCGNSAGVGAYAAVNGSDADVDRLIFIFFTSSAQASVTLCSTVWW